MSKYEEWKASCVWIGKPEETKKASYSPEDKEIFSEAGKLGYDVSIFKKRGYHFRLSKNFSESQISRKLSSMRAKEGEGKGKGSGVFKKGPHSGVTIPSPKKNPRFSFFSAKGDGKNGHHEGDKGNGGGDDDKGNGDDDELLTDEEDDELLSIHSNRRRFSSLGQNHGIVDDHHLDSPEAPYTIEGDRIMFNYVHDDASDFGCFYFPTVSGIPDLVDPTNGKVIHRNVKTQVETDRSNPEKWFKIKREWDHIGVIDEFPKDVTSRCKTDMTRLVKISDKKTFFKRKTTTVFRPTHEMKDSFEVKKHSGLLFVYYNHKSQFSETPEKDEKQHIYEF